MSNAILHLLGAPVFEHGAQEQRFNAERVYQVMAYLAYRSEWVARGALAALFYGDHPEESARRNLRKLLLRARELPWFARSFEATRDSVRWRVATDVQLLTAAARERQSSAVLEIYRGPLLEGLDAPECRGYSEWLETERERLRALWREAAFAQLAQLTSARAAIDLSARLIEADPLDEAAWRANLKALLDDGQTAQAQRAYRTYAARLATELGVEPSVDLRTLFEAPAPASRVAPASAAAPRMQRGDGFIGRVTELQQIAALISQDDCRLLNLVGPGGVGKSSLARRALAQLDAAETGRTCFVALEDVESAADIGARLARDLDIRLTGNKDALLEVADALSTTRALLVLDNFEHLVPGADALTLLLDRCPQLKLILTSRARLAIAHEWLLPVEGLPYPAPEDADRAEAFDAVRLFIQAARRVKPAFTPAAERAALVEICRYLEGLPLALEITAAWTRLLTCAAIVAELKRGTELLRAPDRTRPARQASMEAVFQHSWLLLAPVERDALARLSVFRSAVTRATARAVTRASLPVLAALADKSLLQIGADDRCSLHPLVHGFATERLNENRDDVARRHAEHYCLALAEHAAMEAVDQREVLQRFSPELADAAAALAQARAQERWDLVGPAALVLAQLFDLAGRPREGLSALGAQTQMPAPATRARARSQGQLAIGFATLHHRLADYVAATEDAEQALRAYRSAGDGEGVRMALSILSTTSLKLGRHAESRRYCVHGLKAAERAGDAVGIGTFLNNLGLVESELGNWQGSIEHYERALVVNRAANNRVGVLAQMNNLARAHTGAGCYEQAIALLLEGLRLVDEAGFSAMRSYFLSNLAQASLEMGRPQDARRFADEGLAAAREVADLSNVPGLLLVLSDLALAQGDLNAARRLLQEAAQVTRSTQHRRWLVRSLMVYARVLHAGGDVAGAARVVVAIQRSPAATPVEVTQAQALARQIGSEPPRASASDGKLSLDHLLAEIADAIPVGS
jgi:predicted ATPase/DNA-binding SARP family transcriptional activator